MNTEFAGRGAARTVRHGAQCLDRQHKTKMQAYPQRKTAEPIDTVTADRSCVYRFMDSPVAGIYPPAIKAF